MLTDYELKVIAWYRGLPPLERLAVRCWLHTGDIRLMVALCKVERTRNSFLHFPRPDTSDENALIPAQSFFD